MKKKSGNPKKIAAERTINKVTKNKAKGGAAKTTKESADERKEVEKSIQSAEEVAELVSLWSGVDEEMPWATSWIPFWEVEATGDAYDALYGDVLWDYDIWDLKAIRNAPNP